MTFKINMAATRSFVFILLCLQILVNGEIYPENDSNSFEPHTSEIAAVLNHLNSSSFNVYNYKEATLLHAHTKADITELALDVNVECINKYPGVPCTEKVLTCHAFVRNAPEGSQVLSDVNCKPKPDIVVEEPSYEPPTGGPSELEVNGPKSVALSNEAVSSEMNEPFVAVRKDLAPCLGCPFDVNPDAEGVDELVDLALEHVGSERPHRQALVQVLKVQQQVVSGVKYILIIELGPTVCLKDSPLDSSSCPLDSASETSICEITYLQKPWISKAKHIIGNNCTSSQEYVKIDDKKPEMSNEIDISGTPSKPPASTPNFDHIAESGNLEMSPSRLSDLESQILIGYEEPNGKPVLEAVAPSVVPIDERFEFDPTSDVKVQTFGEETTATTTTDEVATERTVDAQKNCEDSSEEEDRTKRSGESSESAESAETASSATVSEAKQANNSSEESAEVNEAKGEVTESPVHGDNNKSRRRRAIPQLEKITPEEKPLVKNLADFAAAALDNIDDDNHKRIILQILGAKKMVGDDGVYYHLIMRMGISRCLEDRPPNPYENCRDKLFENYTKICKVQVYVNDDFTSPKVVKSQCQNIKRDKNDSNRTNYSRFRRWVKRHDRDFVVGGQTEADKNSEEVKTLLSEGLTNLNAERNTNKHKSVEVVSVTKQVVAGSLTRITAKVVETDCSKNDNKVLEDCPPRKGSTPTQCLFKVWEKPWENFKQFTIKCDGDERTYTIQAPSRSKRQAPGGEILTSTDDRLLDEYLEASLNQLDSQSSQDNKYKVREIVSVTRQVVAGHVYRIKAKVVLTDCKKTLLTSRNSCAALDGVQPKLCNFKIYEALWLPNSRRINVTCDPEPPAPHPTNTELLGDDDPSVRFALFNSFVEKYKKKYTKKEFKYRFKVFSDNLYHIRLLNRYEQGTATYGITQFADLTQAEFSKSLGLRPELRNENEPPFAQARIPDVEIPAEFDWRTKGAVTEVKNQEQCGSCWAFSVTGNVEGQYAIKHGNLLEFSEQELVDCDTADQGCNGGLMDTAYRQIEKLGGLETEQDYPYDAEDEKCHFNRTLARVQLSGAVNISQDEGDMAKWLVANGPISIAINANAMQFYFGGISHPFKFLCNPKNLDHGVLIVGYGVHTYQLFNKTLPYWIVKNSWGTSWGEQGYYRVYRGDGTCGVNQTPSSAIVV